MMLFGVLDNLVTDRPDNAPPLAGKAFHGSPWHEFFRVNETRQFSIHQVQALVEQHQFNPLLEKAKLLARIVSSCCHQPATLSSPPHPVLAIYGAKMAVRLRESVSFVAQKWTIKVDWGVQ